MTINEAIKSRINRVRNRQWAQSEHLKQYLELPLLPDGMIGPWATLVIDPPMPPDMALSNDGKILMFELDRNADEWEPVEE